MHIKNVQVWISAKERHDLEKWSKKLELPLAKTIDLGLRKYKAHYINSPFNWHVVVAASDIRHKEMGKGLTISMTIKRLEDWGSFWLWCQSLKDGDQLPPNPDYSRMVSMSLRGLRY